MEHQIKQIAPLTQRQIAVMIGVRDSKTIVEIAEMVGVTQGVIQKIRSRLMLLGLIGQKVGPNGGGLHRGHYLTEDGVQALEDLGHDAI